MPSNVASPLQPEVLAAVTLPLPAGGGTAHVHGGLAPFTAYEYRVSVSNRCAPSPPLRRRSGPGWTDYSQPLALGR